jgi:hypothetical protein
MKLRNALHSIGAVAIILVVTLAALEFMLRIVDLRERLARVEQNLLPGLDVRQHEGAVQAEL